ncbi:MAG TPA: DUF5655 domain-containing protein [Candidatus Acidoferrum sp.]|nr:DUF5655 domain-containing protein [Candidatus Acidoferrum sp.]
MASAKTARTPLVYDIHPGVAMVQKWIAELKQKTGRSLEEWIAFARKEGPKDDLRRREWLKNKHKLGTNSAWWISERADGKGGEEDSPEAYLKTAVLYVEEQYAGPKEKLRPIYDELLTLGKSIGSDVKACPCKTMVPLYREHVFAQIKPTTNSRIDLGFALTHHKGKLPKRVIDTGGLSKKDRITHRIEITAAAQIDGEVKKWLKTAYDLDA